MDVFAECVWTSFVANNTSFQSVADDPQKSVANISARTVQGTVAKDGVFKSIRAPVLFHILLGRLLTATIESSLATLNINCARIYKPFYIAEATGFQNLNVAQNIDLYRFRRLLQCLVQIGKRCKVIHCDGSFNCSFQPVRVEQVAHDHLLIRTLPRGFYAVIDPDPMPSVT